MTPWRWTRSPTGSTDRLSAQTRPEPIGPLAQLDAADALAPATALRLRGALRWRLREDVDRVEIVLADRSLSLPAGAAPAMKLVLSGDTFRPAELPGLEAEEQLMLSRRLLREGIVVAA